MKSVLVSIIIPTYNRSHLLTETLDSVLIQLYQNWECLVVDDGSTDHTETLLKSYSEKDSRFQYHHRPKDKPKGANACRNYGFEVSKGEFVLFLDSDDILKNTCLEYRLKAFEYNEDLDFVIAQTSYYKNRSFILKPMFEFPLVSDSRTYLSMFLSYELPWTIMSVLWKRETIKNVKFNEQLLRFQDIDFHVNVLLSKNLTSYRLKEIDTFYRVDEDKMYEEKFIDIVLSALVQFNDLHKDLIKKLDYKNCLRVFNGKIIFEYVIPFFYQNKKTSNKLILFYITSKMYNPIQRLNFLVLFFLLNTSLFKIKGIGMYRFLSFFRSNILSK